MNKFNVGDVVHVSHNTSCYRRENGDWKNGDWKAFVVAPEVTLIIMSENVKDILEIFSLNSNIKDDSDWKNWRAILHPVYGVLCIEYTSLKCYV